MIKIETSKYQTLKEMIEETDSTPTFALAILDEFIEGTVLTDSKLQNSYLIGTPNGTYHVLGVPTQNFIKEFRDYYRSRVSERFTIFTPNTEWEEIIALEVAKDSQVMKRKLFTFNKEKYSAIPNVDKEYYDFDIKPIDKATISKSKIYDPSYYQQHWGDTRTFLENGFGVCAINKNNEVVSECTSIFRSKSRAEIDIYTSESVRGRGLARKVATEFIKKCLEIQISASWDCASTNKTSIHLAEALQFERGKEYKIFYK